MTVLKKAQIRERHFPNGGCIFQWTHNIVLEMIVAWRLEEASFRNRQTTLLPGQIQLALKKRAAAKK